MHDTLLDSGIAKIYPDHLETARGIATEIGVQIETHLLEGKAYAAIWRHLEKAQPTLLALGRTGIHADDGLDIGSTPENLFRLAPCHMLLIGRGLARQAIEDYTRQQGKTVVDEQIVSEARQRVGM